MPKFIDLTGQKYGKLTVVERIGSRKGSVTWRCTCECGGEAIVTSNCLRTGKTKTCGCSKRFVKIGETYGRLTVLERLSERTNSKRILYLCKCSCGNTVKRTVANILGTKVPSCGCVQHEVKIGMDIGTIPFGIPPLEVAIFGLSFGANERKIEWSLPRGFCAVPVLPHTSYPSRRAWVEVPPTFTPCHIPSTTGSKCFGSTFVYCFS